MVSDSSDYATVGYVPTGYRSRSGVIMLMNAGD